MNTRAHRTLFLIANSRCDIACSYCFYSTGHEQRDNHQVRVVDAELAIEKLKKLSFGTVVITGGDPLSVTYRETALDLIRIFQDNGLVVIVNTSAVFLNEAYLRRLVDLDPYRIDISLDSHVAKTHNFQRAGFDDVVCSIETLVRLGYGRIVVTVVVTQQNRAQLRAIRDFVTGMGVFECRFQPAFIPARASTKNERLRLTLDSGFRAELQELALLQLNPASESLYFRYWSRFFVDSDSGLLDLRGALPRCRMSKDLFVATSDWRLQGCFHRPDIFLGDLLSDEPDALLSHLLENELSFESLPPCAGAHCVSLQSRPQSWTHLSAHA
ncbi:radical SAM protein [Achromobacter xylosoxidans]|uniref:radical SAM protein n=1 Tax=Alcaligenes xylosoxydans xylosoxydans TaxID=85698 RepID=UPI003F7661B7